jgi:hypothetical protein
MRSASFPNSKFMEEFAKWGGPAGCSAQRPRPISSSASVSRVKAGPDLESGADEGVRLTTNNVRTN